MHVCVLERDPFAFWSTSSYTWFYFLIKKPLSKALPEDVWSACSYIYILFSFDLYQGCLLMMVEFFLGNRYVRRSITRRGWIWNLLQTWFNQLNYMKSVILVVNLVMSTTHADWAKAEAHCVFWAAMYMCVMVWVVRYKCTASERWIALDSVSLNDESNTMIIMLSLSACEMTLAKNLFYI